MAKTNFVDGNPQQGIQGTIVNAAFLNKIFGPSGHRHDGKDKDGSAALDYAADTGAANAYIIALTPALTAHVVGMPIHFMAANTNTGEASININGLGVKSIVKNFNQPLAAGDIKAGQIIAVAWDGVDYQMISAVSVSESVSPVRDTFRNLVIKNHTINPNYQLSITADEVMLSDGANSKLISALSKTLDITVSGVNGLDTGAEADSTWYHVWVIATADGTKDCLLSASATAPTMPSGYTFKAYLGAVYNSQGSNFNLMYQVNKVVSTPVFIALTGGGASLYTSVSLASIIPITAKVVAGELYVEPSVSLNPFGMRVAADNANENEYSYSRQSILGYGATGTSLSAPFRLLLKEPQTMYYKLANGTSTQAAIYVTSWEY